MASLRVMLLGGLDVRLSSGAPLRLATKKAQALLAYLGLRPGQHHSRDQLAALLWGEKRDDHARGGLRHRWSLCAAPSLPPCPRRSWSRARPWL